MRRTVSTLAIALAVALLAGTAGVVVGAGTWRPAQAAPDAVAVAPDPCPAAFPFEATGTGVNGFLNLTGIPGDSLDAKYLKWIVVNKLRSDVAGAGVAGCGAATAPLVISKRLDRSSVKLIQYSLAGTVIPSAVFAVVKAGERRDEYFRITLTNAKVTSVSSQWKGDLAYEQVKLSYTKICWSYRPQKADGTLEPAIQTCK
jgi:type VI secretion system secreted protein Hcp